MKKDYLFILFLVVFVGSALIRGKQPQEAKTPSGSKYKIVSVEFTLTSDDELAGKATFDNEGHKATFVVKNISKEPINFKDAKYYAVKKDNSKFLLQYQGIENPDFQEASFIINPLQMVRISCARPNSLEIIDILGAFILLENGRKIYFEYDELTGQKSDVTEINKAKNYPKEEGWKKATTSSGNVYLYKEVQEKDCSSSSISAMKSKKDYSYLWNCP